MWAGILGMFSWSVGPGGSPTTEGCDSGKALQRGLWVSWGRTFPCISGEEEEG